MQLLFFCPPYVGTSPGKIQACTPPKPWLFVYTLVHG